MNHITQAIKFCITHRVPSIKFIGPRANIVHNTQKMSTQSNATSAQTTRNLKELSGGIGVRAPSIKGTLLNSF
jgi:hypothetical protein